MNLSDNEEKLPWWENNLVVISVILGLPVVGLLSLGVLSILGFNTSNFPDFASADFFITDLALKLLTLPLGVYLIRVFMRYQYDSE